MVRNLYTDMFAKVRSTATTVLFYAVLLQVPFFKDAPDSFLKEVSLITKKLILLPNQVLLQRGERQHNMYFISNGTLEV